MTYDILVLDLDGTLTNSEKKITPPTREALIEIQQNGKKVVLASGRPTPGVVSLAKELHLGDYGSYILSFNGGKIINCSTEHEILSGIKPNQYTELESKINNMPIVRVENFPEAVTFPVNKFLITGEAALTEKIETLLKEKFHSLLNIYRSEPFFLEVMPQNIDKAHSLQKLLNYLGMSADQMICCGDGFNDLTMIEYAGLGVAMENAQPILKKTADYITKSNDEDGVLHVINEFMR